MSAPFVALPPNDRLSASLAHFVAAGSVPRFLFAIDKRVGSPLIGNLPGEMSACKKVAIAYLCCAW